MLWTLLLSVLFLLLVFCWLKYSCGTNKRISDIELGDLVQHRSFPYYYGRGVVIDKKKGYVRVYWHGLYYINPRWENAEDIEKL